MLQRWLTDSDHNPDRILSQEFVYWVDDHEQHSCNDGHCHLSSNNHVHFMLATEISSWILHLCTLNVYKGGLL